MNPLLFFLGIFGLGSTALLGSSSNARTAIAAGKAKSGKNTTDTSDQNTTDTSDNDEIADTGTGDSGSSDPVPTGDTTSGDAGSDTLYGDSGVDLLDAGEGFDRCFGDRSDDIVVGCEVLGSEDMI